MKTLREILLERHQAAEPKLDAIREQLVAALAPGSTSARAQEKRRSRGWQPEPPALRAGWRQVLWSLRWHAAGLSAAWVVVVLLSLGQAPAPAQSGPRRQAPSPRQLLASLRENQRQVRELTAAPASDQAPEPPKTAPSPQSRIQRPSTAAA
jgi:hypothetical protein